MVTPLLNTPTLHRRNQNIPKDDRHELIKCKEYLKESEARRKELDLRIDANRAALFILRKKGEKNVDRYAISGYSCLVSGALFLRAMVGGNKNIFGVPNEACSHDPYE